MSTATLQFSQWTERLRTKNHDKCKHFPHGDDNCLHKHFFWHAQRRSRINQKSGKLFDKTHQIINGTLSARKVCVLRFRLWFSFKGFEPLSGLVYNIIARLRQIMRQIMMMTFFCDFYSLTLRFRFISIYCFCCCGFFHLDSLQFCSVSSFTN